MVVAPTGAGFYTLRTEMLMMQRLQASWEGARLGRPRQPPRDNIRRLAIPDGHRAPLRAAPSKRGEVLEWPNRAAC